MSFLGDCPAHPRTPPQAASLSAPRGLEAMKAGALPTWPLWAGRGPSDPPPTTPFLS